MNFLIALFSVTVFSDVALAESYEPNYKKLNEPSAADVFPENKQKTKEKYAYAGRANSQCVTEPNVEFEPTINTKLKSSEIKKLLDGNTILSADLDGVFAIYYNGDGTTVGWMPKKTSLDKPDWNVGKVWFDNDQYCRTWDYWNGGKKTCWEVHKGEKRLGLQSFYFICGNGGIAGDQVVVLKGNALGVEYSGRSNKKGGKLSQDEERTEFFVEKYFGNYKFK